MLLGADPTGDEVILDCVGEGEIVVPGGGHIPVLHKRVVEMPVESLLHLRHIFYAYNSADTDLLALLLINLVAGHLDAGVKLIEMSKIALFQNIYDIKE